MPDYIVDKKSIADYVHQPAIRLAIRLLKREVEQLKLTQAKRNETRNEWDEGFLEGIDHSINLFNKLLK